MFIIKKAMKISKSISAAAWKSTLRLSMFTRETDVLPDGYEVPEGR